MEDLPGAERLCSRPALRAPPPAVARRVPPLERITVSAMMAAIAPGTTPGRSLRIPPAVDLRSKEGARYAVLALHRPPGCRGHHPGRLCRADHEPLAPGT